MRKGRRIRKVVNITVPAESSKNIKTNVKRGKIINTNSNHKVPTKVNPNPVRLKTPLKKDLKYHTITPLWAGETVYIIGGGPSLKGFKWNLLSNKKTIAINKAIKYYNNPTALYWTDSRVFRWFRKEIMSYSGLKYTITPNKDHNESIKLLKRGSKNGLSKQKNEVAHGGNSGYAAINLAIHLGAKRIILLGYDMGNVGKESHFHDGYPVNTTSATIYKDQFIPAFDLLKRDLNGSGIEILNASPSSNLNAFKKITIEEALRF